LLNFKQFSGFALSEGDVSQEAGRLYMFCRFNNIPLKYIKKGKTVPKDLVPSGSVEFCSTVLNRKIVPNYYPEWLNGSLYRKVWKCDVIPLTKTFIKPSDRYKRFNGYIIGLETEKTAEQYLPPFDCSEVVDFIDEWRYYVSNGKILAAEWYLGKNDLPIVAPELNITIPSSYCGCLDFGTIEHNSEIVLALVEAQHPFACGWYGKNDENYFQWLIDGWEYMLKTA
jgi:hypothetical protein